MTDPREPAPTRDARQDAVSIPDVLEGLTAFWSQQIVGQANETLLKVAKGIGSTNWHSHDDQDETFLVFDGSLTVQLRDRDVVLGPGDLFIVPRGIEHCPTADLETRFLILGTSITSNAAGGKPDWSYGDSGPDTSPR
ncbi:cupin domain-containing protein [Amnibacterium flavum]|uniref:Cupin domain-containing protein n=1 Tax=Amnibacterium flavum TaxID=2173173 RepID=A0A2V1HXG3_9MICO|nr:cupin domain-containing protein [Amnibacterium flavum]PVZ95337.1 cupin domain-containing protein [Amnibacterium flavum]